MKETSIKPWQAWATVGLLAGMAGAFFFVSNQQGKFEEGEAAMPKNIQLPQVIVEGPDTLGVNKTGTWTMVVSNPQKKPLSYAVFWGDDAASPGPPPVPQAGGSAQNIKRFTHAYKDAGVYVVTFFVTSGAGDSEKKIATVSVGFAKPVKKGALWIDPQAFSLAVGDKKEMRAFYLPSGAVCNVKRCPSSAPVEVLVKWSSSNNESIKLTQVTADCLGQEPGCGEVKTFANSMKKGIASITAVYTNSRGETLKSAIRGIVR